MDNAALVVPVDYYPQKTTTELLALLDSLQKRSTTGALSMNTGGGTQQMRSWQGADRVVVEVRRVLYSLYRKDSTTYQDPYRERIRRTRSLYT